MIRVSPLRRRHERAAARLLADAFLGDPVWQATGPRHARHRRLVLRLMYRGELRIARLSGGWTLGAFDDDVLQGVLIAFPLGERPLAFWIWGFRAPACLLAGPVATLRALRISNALDERHPKEPHVHCWQLGSDSASRGLGALLMGSAISRAKDIGRPLYLEATAPHLAQFYGLLGYDVLGDYKLRTGAPITFMWRPLETLREPPSNPPKDGVLDLSDSRDG